MRSARASTNCTQNGNNNLAMIWLAILLLTALLELSGHVVEGNIHSPLHRRVYRRAVRLCSRNLSEGLNLLCKDRGFNGPFTGDDQGMMVQAGPGLVEECCYNTCSIEQMEQYCKPMKVQTEAPA